MARYKILLGTLLCVSATIGPASFVTAKQGEQQARAAQAQQAVPARASGMTQINPPSLQTQLRAADNRSKVQANITGISVDDVLAAAARIERASGDATAREQREEKDAGEQRVSRAQIAALSRVAPAARQVTSPDNVVPPIRAQVQRRIPRPVPSGSGQLAAPPKPSLDVAGFGQDLHQALSGSVQGYTMRMRRNGQNIYTLQWNWARRPGEGQRGWNPDRRMNIASVSKFITAAAMVDLLERRNIDPDTPIAQWLPSYWKLGANVDDITFAMLMTHSSGLANSGSTDFPTMRQLVAAGVTPNLPTSFTYENTNFGLQRILIATLGGYVKRNLNLGLAGLNDSVWNAATTAAYEDYVEKNIFAPAGVTNAGFEKTADTAIAYAINGGPGWNSGDLSWRAGSGGWHLSVDEILDVVGTYRYTGKIVSTGEAGSAIANRYGLDGRWSTTMGFVYHKNGSWIEQANCPVGQRQEQSLLLLLPDNMEMALLVNSPVGPNCTFLRGVVQQILLDNIVEPGS